MMPVIRHFSFLDCFSLLFKLKFIELIEILIDQGAQANPSDEYTSFDENTPQCHLLHFAADDNLIDVARVLIEKGKIPINKLDQSGWSPLHIAAGHNFIEFVRLLLKYKADINIKVCKHFKIS